MKQINRALVCLLLLGIGSGCTSVQTQAEREDSELERIRVLTFEPQNCEYRGDAVGSGINVLEARRDLKRSAKKLGASVVVPNLSGTDYGLWTISYKVYGAAYICLPVQLSIQANN